MPSATMSSDTGTVPTRVTSSRFIGRSREPAQSRVFEALLTLLDLLGRHEPVLFAIEDLHWADASTRAFLSFLARSLRSERVLLVASYRPDELHRRHPLRPLLAELERGPR